MRKQIAAANWKMNLSPEEGKSLIGEIVDAKFKLENNQEVIIAVPFLYLSMASGMVENINGVHIAAQDCSAYNNGAYTGQVSAEMLSQVGISYVIIGHSERRQYNQETNKELAGKLNQAMANNLTVIFCCGEPLNVREEGSQEMYVKKQLDESLCHLSTGQHDNLIIAYEPIWAIGTGKTATTQQAQEMHAFIRLVLNEKFGEDAGNEIPILYGGSVKPANATEIFGQPDVDGGLVGGASLDAKDFLEIIKSLKP